MAHRLLNQVDARNSQFAEMAQILAHSPGNGQLIRELRENYTIVIVAHNTTSRLRKESHGLTNRIALDHV